MDETNRTRYPDAAETSGPAEPAVRSVLRSTSVESGAARAPRDLLWATATACGTILAALALWRIPSIIVDGAPGTVAKHASDHSFEITKIILDKGLLALLLAALGFVFSRSIERLKADFARRNEEAKEDRAISAALLKEQRDTLLDLQRDERRVASDERRRERDRAEAAAQSELDRTYVPRTQFDISCRFHGPVGDMIIAAIELSAENRGGSVRAFERMTYRVLSMLDDAEPSLRTSVDGIRRLAFDGDHIKEQTAEGRTFSVEPGIRQVFPLTTLIDVRARFVLVKVEMNTHRQGQPGATWLAEERFFPVVLETRRD